MRLGQRPCEYEWLDIIVVNLEEATLGTSSGSTQPVSQSKHPLPALVPLAPDYQAVPSVNLGNAPASCCLYASR